MLGLSWIIAIQSHPRITRRFFLRGLAVSMVAFKGTQSNVPLRGGKPAVSNDTSVSYGEHSCSVLAFCHDQCGAPRNTTELLFK